MPAILREISDYLHAQAGNKELTDEIRGALGPSAPQIPGSRVYYESLVRDPGAPDTLYVAADLERPSLLRCRPGAVEVLPFAPSDREAIRHFAEKIDRAFLPRPQRDARHVTATTPRSRCRRPRAFAASRVVRRQPGQHGATIATAG
jgi:hypothetical protein